MRSYLTDLLLFVLVALVVYAAVIIGAGALAPYHAHRNIKFRMGVYGHLYSRIREIPAHADVDILFLGSSHAYRGFDPRVFSSRGLRTFNLGSSSQSPLQTKLLVARYLDHLNPQLVVMDVYPLTFDIDGVESSLDLIANDTIRLDMLYMALKLKNIGVLNTLLYGSIRQLFGLDAAFQEPMVINNDTYVSGGYVQKDPGPFRLRPKREPLGWGPPDYQQLSFATMMVQLRSRGIPVILIQTPVTSVHRYSTEEREMLAMHFGRFAPYVDLSDLFPQDDSTLFYDGHHLTQQGVELFNGAFIDTLMQRGFLPLPPL